MIHKFNSDKIQKAASSRVTLTMHRRVVTQECRSCALFPTPRALPVWTLAATLRPGGTWEQTTTSHEKSGLKVRIPVH